MTDKSSKDGFAWVLGVTAVAAVLALAVSIVAITLSGSSGTASAGTAAGGTETFEVELGEFYVEPSSIEVAPGTEVILQFTNAGTMPHDLKLNGETGSDLIDPGASSEVSLGVVDASSEAWCTVAGHREAGMVMTIEVTGSAQAAGAADPHDAGGAGGSDRAVIDLNAEPAAAFQPYDPLCNRRRVGSTS